MAYSSIDVGTQVNDGTGDTLVATMTKINSNDLDIESNIDLEISNRTSDLVDCAKSNISNIFSFPNATSEYQTLSGNSITLDFSVDKPHNFYLPHGLDIYLDAPIGLSAGFYPSGWILTEGFITNWENTFIEGDDNTKPLSYSSYSGQGLYLYFVLSNNTIVFRKFKTEQIIETTPSEDAPLYPVTFDSLTDTFTELADGTYVTNLVITWTKNVLDTTDQFRVIVHNGTDTVYDSTVIETVLIVSPIKDTDIEHTVTIYATDGKNLSTPVSDVITPSGDYSTLQDTSGKNLTLSNTSLWGRSDAGDTTFYLDGATGDVTMGDTDNRNVSYDATSGSLEVTGKIKLVNIGDPIPTEYGQITTGTAEYDVTTGSAGTGLMMSSQGIFGIKNDDFTFGVYPSGNVKIGVGGAVNTGSLLYDATDGRLFLNGRFLIQDIEDPPGTKIQDGFVATGTADWDSDTGLVTGSGILVGTAGIFGIHLGVVTFRLDAETGDFWMLGDSTELEGPNGLTLSMTELVCLVVKSQKTADLALQRILDLENNP